jgi:hypothetical protein
MVVILPCAILENLYRTSNMPQVLNSKPRFVKLKPAGSKGAVPTKVPPTYKSASVISVARLLVMLGGKYIM